MSIKSTLEECVALPIPNDVLIELTTKAKDWAIMHGAAMRSKTNFSPDSMNFAPFLLTPSSLPRREFEKAVQMQTIINRLIHYVAHDEEFLTTVLSETIKVDEFTANLFNIYKKVLSNGFEQPISLGILRSDMMLESRCKEMNTSTGKSKDYDIVSTFPCWKQVELNTMASGFGHLGPASRAIQSGRLSNVVAYREGKFAVTLGILRSDYLANTTTENSIKQVEINTIASSFGGIIRRILPLQSYVLGELSRTEQLRNMPDNHALPGICGGMVKAWEIYNCASAVILFIIEDISYNICDQRFHEFYIREKWPHITVMRRTLTQVHETGRLGLEKQLIVGSCEVAVIYFRSGYDPSHYYGQNEWDARYMMECSKAIKCPSIQYHLAGTKKVQQALAQPGMLERFFSDPEEIKAVGKLFTGLYSLDDNEDGNSTYEMAMNDPENFVLKPQREGGGNNIYGKDIPHVLRKMSRAERSAWILMDIIKPPVSRGYIIRPGVPIPPPLVEVVSELGIFGVIIGESDNIICNYQSGHMLRSKLSGTNEGGVAAGLGALDSPYLVD